MARKITKRERSLLIIFFGAIFLMFNLFGVTFLLHRQSDLQSHLTDLKNQRQEARSWLAEKDMWLQREAWLDKTQPKLQSVGESNAAMLQVLQNSARKHDITIMEQGFGDPVTQTYYKEISVKLKISGSLEAITRWLVELQQPANFQAIPAFSMKSDSDATKIICELTVARWFH